MTSRNTPHPSRIHNRRSRICNRDSRIHNRHSRVGGNPALWLLAAVLVVIVVAASLACSSQSPNIGRYYKGRVLHVSIADLERTDELRWTTSTRSPRQGATDEDFYRLVPESAQNELILLRVKIENHTATNAIVNVNHESAQLRDFLQGRYFPIDVAEQAQEAGVPESASDRCNVPVNPDDHTACVKFLWNPLYAEEQSDGQVKYVERAQELPRGTGLDGWMVFEVPEGTQMRSFRWSAGDTVTIDF